MIRELWSWIRLLSRRERLGWLMLLTLGACTALLEGLAALATYGLLSALMGGTAVPLSGWLSRVGQLVSPLTGGHTAVAFALVATVVLVSKNALQLLAAAGRARVGGATATAISSRALRGYLNAPYVVHLRRSSTEFSHHLITAVPAVVGMYDALIVLVTEGLVIAGLFGLLSRLAWFETLVATTVILAPLVPFVWWSRRTYARLGETNYHLGLQLHRVLDQAFGGVKELKVLGREQHFQDRADHTVRQRARVGMQHAALEHVPRVLTETAFVVGMLALVLVLARRPGLGAALLPFVGLYAYAGFRIIPSAHRIALQTNTLRYALSMAASLRSDLITLREPAPPDTDTADSRLRFTESIRFDQVSFTYPDASRAAVQDLTLTIRHDACVGIIGPTGAGKSTMLDLLLGLLTPSSGHITVDGVPVQTNLRGWQHQLGYVPQTPFFVDDTLRRNIALGVADTEIDEARVLDSVRIAQLEDWVAGLDDGLDTVIGERGVRISGGERQRLSVARALYRDPAVLVFDEATSSLDGETERDLTHALRQLRGRKTIIIVTHRPSSLEACDQIVHIAEGRITTGDAGNGTPTP